MRSDDVGDGGHFFRRVLRFTNRWRCCGGDFNDNRGFGDFNWGFSHDLNRCGCRGGGRDTRSIPRPESADVQLGRRFAGCGNRLDLNDRAVGQHSTVILIKFVKYVTYVFLNILNLNNFNQDLLCK